MFAIHVVAGVDINGNARRLYLVCSQHGPVAAIHEGPEGSGSLRNAGVPDCPIVGTIHVKPAEIKRLLKLYPLSERQSFNAQHREFATQSRAYAARVRRGESSY